MAPADLGSLPLKAQRLDADLPLTLLDVNRLPGLHELSARGLAGPQG